MKFIFLGGVAIVAVSTLIVIAIWLFSSSSRAEFVQSTGPFRMPIDDIFALKEHGKVVVVGTIAEGEVRPRDHLIIKSKDQELKVEVEALEAFGESVPVGRQGKKIGIMLRGANKDEIPPDATVVRK